MTMVDTTTKHERSRSIKVWDPLVRVFHWSLAGFFFFAYLTGDAFQDAHAWAGYAVAMLIGFRLVWGFIGTRHARFSDFVSHPAKAVAYLGQLVRGKPPHYLGHNPAGGLMIVALLAAVALTALTGMALLGGDGAGPLAGIMPTALSGEWLEETHEFFGDATLLLVALHVAGVIVGSIAERENLVRAMFTGRKSRRRAIPATNSPTTP